MKSKRRRREVVKSAKFQERINAVRLTGENTIKYIKAGSINVPHGWVLLVCDRGTATVIVNSHRIEIVENNVLIILPDQMVAIESYSEDLNLYFTYLPVETAVTITEQSKRPDAVSETPDFSLPQQMVMMLVDGTTEASELHTMPKTVINDLKHLIDVLIDIIEKESPNHARLRAMIIESISLILMESTPTVEDNSDKKKSRQQIICRQFFADLVKEYQNQHDVAYYAKKIGITPKYLSTLVRNETGEAALQWINKIVVFGAKKMLRTTHLSIAEVSDELHFSSPSAFIRFFKKQTGHTPLAYRN